MRLARFLIAGVLSAGATMARADTVEVTIDALAFAPAEVHARAGDTIRWVNKDALLHTATVRGAWDVQIAPGKSATRVVAAPGTVDYFCRFHPNMKGRIVVSP